MIKMNVDNKVNLKDSVKFLRGLVNIAGFFPSNDNEKIKLKRQQVKLMVYTKH